MGTGNKKWKPISEALVLMTGAVLLAHCARSTAPATQSVKPRQCAASTAATGNRAYYGGATGPGTGFPDASVDYFGKVVAVFDNGTAEIAWDDLTAHSVAPLSVLYVQTACNAELITKRCNYLGPTGSAEPNFPDEGKTYFGTIKGVFTGNFAEVSWEHLPYTTVEKLEDLAVAL